MPHESFSSMYDRYLREQSLIGNKKSGAGPYTAYKVDTQNRSVSSGKLTDEQKLKTDTPSLTKG